MHRRLAGGPPPGRRRAALQAHHGTRLDPGGKRRHPPREPGVGLDLFGRGGASVDPNPHAAAPDLHLHAIGVSEVEAAQRVGLETEAPPPAGEEVGHGGIGLGVAATRTKEGVHDPGQRLHTPPDAGLLAEDGELSTLQVDVGELLSEAEEPLGGHAAKAQEQARLSRKLRSEGHGQVQLQVVKCREDQRPRDLGRALEPAREDHGVGFAAYRIEVLHRGPGPPLIPGREEASRLVHLGVTAGCSDERLASNALPQTGLPPEQGDLALGRVPDHREATERMGDGRG